jgi:hypothetical protein
MPSLYNSKNGAVFDDARLPGPDTARQECLAPFKRKLKIKARKNFSCFDRESLLA